MYGQLLFSTQVIAMVFCFIPPALSWPKPLVWLLLLLVSLITLWVLWVNRLGNWSVFPQPLEQAKLITSGPYGLVRHPMYSAILLFGLTCVIHNQTLTSLLSLSVLAGILRLKAGYEEKLLTERFEPYARYMTRVSKRFLPGVI